MYVKNPLITKVHRKNKKLMSVTSSHPVEVEEYIDPVVNNQKFPGTTCNAL